MTSLIDRVDAALQWAAESASGHVVADELASARARLHEPLRVAIAGRVKAGKSTLLNALVGERVARTDASECTQIVTWFRHGDHYAVAAELSNGSRTDLRFERTDGRLDIHLDGLDVAGIDRLDVHWPSRRLIDLTLIDTPGLESMTPEAADRTKRFFAVDEAGPGQADAIIYLIRHLHASDVDFLETFLDRSVAQPTPFNALAVLSRADELGAGRLDAMTSAHAIARRYEADARVRTLCSGVAAVAGLLAETGITLTEDEVAALRRVASTDPAELEGMLLSVDRFRDPAASEVSSQVRGRLLDRLGMFGIRLLLERLIDDPGVSAPELSRAMIEESGIEALTSGLEDRFGPRADVLKARSALAKLRQCADRLMQDDEGLARQVSARVEAIEASSTELTELRIWQLAISEQIALSDEEFLEVRRLTSGSGPAERLGVGVSAPPAELSAAALAGADRWRTRSGHPLSDRITQEASELIARSYEHLYSVVQTDP
jgi:hypothetical protein